MKKYKYVMLLALTVLALASAAIASAQGPAPQGQPPQGQQPGQAQQGQQPGQQGQMPQGQPMPGADWSGVVQSVTSASLTVLRANNETFTAVVSSTTHIEWMMSQTTGSLSDIQVGNNVTIDGRKTSDGSVAANRILVEPSGTKVFGAVSKISSAMISITNPNQTISVVTTSGTKFYKGTSAASLSDVTQGAMLTAYGTKQSDGSISATYVIINGGNAPGQGQLPNPAQTPQAGPTPAGTPQPRPTQAQPPDGQRAPSNWVGTVQTVGSSSLGVLRPDNTTFTATISSTTKIELAISQSAGTVSDISVGNNVTIEGRPVTTSTVSANRILVEPSGTKVDGTVNAVSGTTITVVNPQSTVTVLTTSSTQFITNQVAGSLSDVTTGAMITAYGTKQSDGSISATYVLVNTNGQDRPPQTDQGPDLTTTQDQSPTTGNSSNMFEQFLQWLANRFR